jgi:hypothetical protein
MARGAACQACKERSLVQLGMLLQWDTMGI